MLRVYSTLLEIIRDLRPVLEEIRRHNPDLARQGDRALPSAALNTAEGSRSRGRNRKCADQDAAGSLQEGIAVIEVADASGCRGSKRQQGIGEAGNRDRGSADARIDVVAA